MQRLRGWIPRKLTFTAAMTTRTLNLTHPGNFGAAKFDAALPRQADLIGLIAEAIYELSVRRILRAISRSV